VFREIANSLFPGSQGRLLRMVYKSKDIKVGHNHLIQSIKGVKRSDILSAVESLVKDVKVDENALVSGEVVKSGNHMIKVTPNGDAFTIVAWTTEI
jgi:hypothetical protein